MECSGTVVLQPSFSFSTSGITYMSVTLAILKASRTKKPVCFLIIIENSEWNFTKTSIKLLSLSKKNQLNFGKNL